MATPTEVMDKNLSFRRYEEGDSEWDDFSEKIFVEDTSHKCPTYIHKTAPCQGSCPSGEDIRGYLAIARGQEIPPEGVELGEYMFQRSTDGGASVLHPVKRVVTVTTLKSMLASTR